jgi:predicted O-methyltransferase YrrM
LSLPPLSAFYLAAAVRDNVRSTGGNGFVIETEIEPTKAAMARANCAEAGVGEFVELRDGARETLKDTGGPVDCLLLDSWIPLAKPVAALLAPQLRRPGAIVLCENTTQFVREHADYLEFVHDPQVDFVPRPFHSVVEFSVSVKVQAS